MPKRATKMRMTQLEEGLACAACREGKSITFIGDALCRDRDTLRRLFARRKITPHFAPGKKRLDVNVDRIIAMLDAGWGPYEVAAELSISTQTIRRRLRDAGRTCKISVKEGLRQGFRV